MPLKNQPYPSVDAFRIAHGITLPRPHNWRFTETSAFGEVAGLPGLRGQMIATNGILLAIETDHGKVHFVHLENFIPDQEELPERESAPVRTNRKLQAVLAEYN